jgi:hypothetical protein
LIKDYYFSGRLSINNSLKTTDIAEYSFPVVLRSILASLEGLCYRKEDNEKVFQVYSATFAL